MYLGLLLLQPAYLVRLLLALFNYRNRSLLLQSELVGVIAWFSSSPSQRRV